MQAVRNKIKFNYIVSAFSKQRLLSIVFNANILLFYTQIVDPTATKPDDWDEDAPAQIVDPNAVKPDGWLDDEPEMIPG